MNREFAKALRLRDDSKPPIIGMPKYIPGLVINTSDRQYQVMADGSWRVMDWLPEVHEFPAIVRDNRHASKYHKKAN